MALQSIGLGSAADDGTGDTLRAAGTKVNENFDEVYTLLGDGTTLSSGISSSATVVTLTAPALSGSVTGTYTLAGTPTITSPLNIWSNIYWNFVNCRWCCWSSIHNKYW